MGIPTRFAPHVQHLKGVGNVSISMFNLLAAEDLNLRPSGHEVGMPKSVIHDRDAARRNRDGVQCCRNSGARASVAGRGMEPGPLAAGSRTGLIFAMHSVPGRLPDPATLHRQPPSHARLRQRQARIAPLKGWGLQTSCTSTICCTQGVLRCRGQGDRPLA